MKLQYKVKWCLALSVLLVVSACAPHSAPNSLNTAGMSELRVDIREWNRTAAPFVSAYNDQTISADRLVSLTTPIVKNLENVVASMHHRDLSALPPSLQAAFHDIITSYDNKLSAVNQILVAVQLGNVEAETAAQAGLARANSEAARSVCALAAAAIALDGQSQADAQAALAADNC